MNLKREVGLVIATAMIVSGLFMINNSETTIERKISPSKIIKIDENTEIRIVEGIKYRCTIINNK